MKRKFHPLLRGAAMFVIAFVVPLFTAPNAKAFALLGPYADWMTITNGYDFDIGGPMNIGEGYRWNVPVVTYAFDQSFVDAFGTNGIAAVESAIAILNNLPPASQLDLSNFPLNTTQMNIPAGDQSLTDLKSTTLFLLLQQLGLARPSRYSSSLHDFSVTGGIITGNFLDRNFDPFSLVPTNSVNEIQYTNFLYFDGGQADFANWFNFPIDSFSPEFTAVADQGPVAIPPGNFFIGLTRDDVGGLRYLLQTNNYAFETLLPDVHGIGTNLNNYANLALRAGVDKITFMRQDYDSLLGEAYIPVTNDFIDHYLTNNTLVHQQLERVISKPDFIFSAFGSSNGLPVICTDTSNWLNNSALNGSVDSEGPGIIRPQVNIAFQKYGLFASVGTGDAAPYDSTSISAQRWASFDNSTNPPLIFPDKSTANQVNELEVILFLSDTNYSSLGSFAWYLPISYGESAIVQTSTNLVDWVSRGTITNYGLKYDWTHICTEPQGFFRVIPQTNSP